MSERLGDIQERYEPVSLPSGAIEFVDDKRIPLQNIGLAALGLSTIACSLNMDNDWPRVLWGIAGGFMGYHLVDKMTKDFESWDGGLGTVVSGVVGTSVFLQSMINGHGWGTGVVVGGLIIKGLLFTRNTLTDIDEGVSNTVSRMNDFGSRIKRKGNRFYDPGEE